MAACTSTLVACGVALSSVSDASSSVTVPKSRLIVLERSIGGVRLGEPRHDVVKALGPGTVVRRGEVSYFGGRLTVDYWFKQTLTRSVEGIWTHWPGFHTRSGLRVGSSRARLIRVPRMQCGEGECSRYAVPRYADGPGTEITTRHQRITEFLIAYV